MPTPGFNQFLADLAGQAAGQAAAAGLAGVVPRPWQIPTAYPVGVDPANPAGFVAACYRGDLNALAVAAYQTGNVPGGGRHGQVMAVKKAIDYQAAFERALHARHASAVRCRVWAGARRAGHGDQVYGVFAAVGRDIALTLAAATAADPNGP